MGFESFVVHRTFFEVHRMFFSAGLFFDPDKKMIHSGPKIVQQQKCPMCHRKMSYVSQKNVLCVTEKCPMCHRKMSYVSQKNVLCVTEKCPMCHRKMSYVSQKNVLCVTEKCPMHLRKTSYVPQKNVLCATKWLRSLDYDSNPNSINGDPALMFYGLSPWLSDRCVWRKMNQQLNWHLNLFDYVDSYS